VEHHEGWSIVGGHFSERMQHEDGAPSKGRIEIDPTRTKPPPF